MYSLGGSRLLRTPTHVSITGNMWGEEILPLLMLSLSSLIGEDYGRGELPPIELSATSLVMPSISSDEDDDD